MKALTLFLLFICPYVMELLHPRKLEVNQAILEFHMFNFAGSHL